MVAVLYLPARGRSKFSLRNESRVDQQQAFASSRSCKFAQQGAVSMERLISVKWLRTMLLSNLQWLMAEQFIHVKFELRNV